MRPADLRSAEELARKHPHGHKMRYMAGCRCKRCRQGSAAYDRQQRRNREQFGPNDLVSTRQVKKHLKYLQTFGIGHQTVAKHARVAKTVLGKILWYGKKQIRRRNARRVLAVQPTIDTLPKNAKVPADLTVAKIRQLIAWGYPKSLINKGAFGLNTCGLQVRALEEKAQTVAAKTAVKIRNFFTQVEAIRQLWKERRGVIPAGHYVYWKRGTRGALELRPFSLAYNYHYLYAPEFKAAIQARNKLRKLLREEKCRKSR